MKRNQEPIIVNNNTPQFVSWFAGVVKLCDDYAAQHYPNNPKEKLEFYFGPRYVKIDRLSVEIDPVTKRPHNVSAWAFIDRTTGGVLKPAGYKAPAKGERGNIFDSQNGLGTIGPYGPAYLR